MTRKSDQVTLDILSAWQLNLILFGPGPGDPGKTPTGTGQKQWITLLAGAFFCIHQEKNGKIGVCMVLSEGPKGVFC